MKKIYAEIAELTKRHPGALVSLTEIVEDQGEPLIVEKTWRDGIRIGWTNRRSATARPEELL